MADEPPINQPPPTPSSDRVIGRVSCTFVSGLLLVSIVSTLVGGVAVGRNNPPWMFLAVSFGPILLYLTIWAAFGLPALTRQLREAARNAPSPESVAAAAGGEGVEVGRKPDADKPDEPDDTPAVPKVETTPGKVLTHRLTRSGMTPGCEFGCAVGVTVFWNAIVGFFIYKQVAAWNAGGAGFFGGWLSVVFLIPFVLAGLVMIAYAVYSGLRLIGAGLAGTVEVELSAHPLTPGGAARLHISQRGPFPLSRVTVHLVCTEEATYVAGTSKSTAKKEVAAHTLADPDQNPDGGGLPLEAVFTVPDDAMHSFDAPNNKINWTVRVTGRVLGLPFAKEYAVAIVPG